VVEIDHSDMAATDGGTIAVGVYEAVHLPAGARVTGGFAIVTEAFPGSVTIDIGDEVDPDRYIKNDAAASGTVVYPVISSLAEQTLGNVAYLCPTGYKYTANDTIDVTVAGAAPTASGKLLLIVKYTIDGRSAFVQK
jgi:hypothetical protein